MMGKHGWLFDQCGRHIGWFTDRWSRLLANELETRSASPYAIPIAVKVKAILNFYASGSFQHPLNSFGGSIQPRCGHPIWHAARNS